MQLMTWTLARLGSRFSLVFEPNLRRVRHSALGRFLDRPMDLMVGLIEPDGTERVLPFTSKGELLYNPEQFERLNSITFRGYSEHYGLRFEFNIHSVFYPQDEKLCLLPVYYLEVRVNPAPRVRWHQAKGATPTNVKLFIRLDRPDTQITTTVPDSGVSGSAADPGSMGSFDSREAASIELAYDNTLTPSEIDEAGRVLQDNRQTVAVRERIVSLNPGCVADPGGKGLLLDLPVTQEGMGIKWRLVWGAHTAEPVLAVGPQAKEPNAPFRYTHHWQGLDTVMEEAIEMRDAHLSHSRRFEKLLSQVTLSMSQRHLLNQSFQVFLGNTFWCQVADEECARESGVERESDSDVQFPGREWFSVWDGSCYYHSTIDVEYNAALFYLTLWPRLLALQLEQWSENEKPDKASGGSFLGRDLGSGMSITGQSYPHDMPVECTSDYLLLLQTYSHWTGDNGLTAAHVDLVERLSVYLIWTDRDGCGFPSEGTANTVDDASPAVQYARKQTYLAIKRVVALQAAADMLSRSGRSDAAERCERVVETAPSRIDKQAWLGDHYAVCIDSDALGVQDAWTGKALPDEQVPGWDAYSIYTGNGLLLPSMIAQPTLLDDKQLLADLRNAKRETLSPYGCGHSSYEPSNVWVSQNLWRDFMARYLGCSELPWSQRYWDLQVMSNTHRLSLGYVDSYIGNNLSFYPRGVVSIGYLLAYPRLVIDRLAPGGARISVKPDRHYPQRWPLLPLAEWKAGRVPVCVVDDDGNVAIEGESDPVIVHGSDEPAVSGMIG